MGKMELEPHGAALTVPMGRVSSLAFTDMMGWLGRKGARCFFLHFFKYEFRRCKKTQCNQTSKCWALPGSSLPSRGRDVTPVKKQMSRKCPVLPPPWKAWLTSHQRPRQLTENCGRGFDNGGQPWVRSQSHGFPRMWGHPRPMHLRDLQGGCWEGAPRGHTEASMWYNSPTSPTAKALGLPASLKAGPSGTILEDWQSSTNRCSASFSQDDLISV